MADHSLKYIWALKEKLRPNCFLEEKTDGTNLGTSRNKLLDCPCIVLYLMLQSLRELPKYLGLSVWIGSMQCKTLRMRVKIYKTGFWKGSCSSQDGYSQMHLWQLSTVLLFSKAPKVPKLGKTTLIIYKCSVHVQWLKNLCPLIHLDCELHYLSEQGYHMYLQENVLEFAFLSLIVTQKLWIQFYLDWTWACLSLLASLKQPLSQGFPLKFFYDDE